MACDVPHLFQPLTICDALRDLVAFVQFKCYQIVQRITFLQKCSITDV